MAKDDQPRKPATRLVTGGRRPEWTGAAVNPPVWRASTFLYENMADLKGGRKNADGQFYYGRRGSPTQWALAEALTDLEPGAAGTVLYPSGVAAISAALLTVLRPGDVLLVTDNAYEPSRNLGLGMLRDFGIETRFFDPLNIESFHASLCPRAKAVLLESPGSLTMEVCDVPALTTAARDKGMVSLIDNTWAGPLGFAALGHGADIALMSLTKHVSGHSDVMMGSATAGSHWYAKLRQTAQALGNTVSADDAALMLRGLRTMKLRLERESESALAVASWLSTRPEVASVLCPMLPGAAGHELWRRDFTGGCGLFSFILKGGDEAARARLVDALELFGIGYSFGGYESLVIPVDPAAIRTVLPWPPEGLDQDSRLGLRLSIGLEDAGDLIADLERGFAAWRAS